MRTHRIAAIPGDGIGAEVIAAGIEVLDVCATRDGGFAFAFDHFDWGSERYKQTGAFMPESGLGLIKDHAAILFGSAGVPDVPDHITLWGLRLAICQPFDQYANVRPTRILPGITSPLRNVSGPELDWVLSFGRTPKANMPASAAGSIAACPRRPRPTYRCSPAPASPASCALRSHLPARAHASSSPS